LTELQQRQQRASQGPNYYSGPPDDILERIRAGLRRDDVGRGQADPTIKDRAKGIEVEEVTPEEIEAAGGDVMAARAEKIARIQAEQRRQQGQ
jgi:mono/diheme cytochrome c family protein